MIAQPKTTTVRTAHVVAGLIVFAVLVRLILGLLYQNHEDLDDYKSWAVGLQNGFFNSYARMMDDTQYPLNYPPLFFIFYWVVGKAYALFPAIGSYGMWDMLAMKFFPIVFDVLTAWLLYHICKKYSEPFAVLAAGLWALNPMAIFNAAGWGQTDGILAFFLLLAFYTAERNRPLLGAVLYAVACLCKLQAFFFLPVVFAYLWRRYSLKKAGIGAAAALGTGILGFAPFVIGGWQLQGAAALQTPFIIYFGGLDTYRYASVNAYNLYNVFGLNGVSDVGIWGIVSIFFLVVMMGLAFFGIFRSGDREESLFVNAAFLMDGLFILTTRQHERYQFLVVPLLIVVWARLRTTRWFWLLTSVSAIAFLNQFLFLTRCNGYTGYYYISSPWENIFYGSMSFFSVVNVLLFGWLCYEWLNYIKNGGKLWSLPQRSPR